MTQRIAIVGGGCAGVLVAAQILRQAREPVCVVLIERSLPLGRGLAYGTKHDDHLLNVPAARMSAWPDDPDHFLRWIQARAATFGLRDPVSADEFLPRRLYGIYLAEVIQDVQQQTLPYATLEIVAGEVVDIEEMKVGARITLGDGKVIATCSVVLALGVLPGEYPIQRPLPFYHGSHYVHLPWAPEALDGIDRKDELLVVGAGLTAIDIVIQCRASGHKGRIHALSRRGLRPQVHRATNSPSQLISIPSRLPTTTREAFAWLRREVRSAGFRGLDWRPVFDAVRPRSQELWQGLSWEERARFMRHVRPIWEIHRHRLAPATAAIVEEMEGSGQLRFYAGRLVELHDEGKGASALVKIRNQKDLVAFRVAKVINCTGPRTDYSKYQHPLLINLLAAGLIGHDPLALGIESLPDGEILRYNRRPAGWLFAIGALLKGTLWESTAVPEIRCQAQILARRILNDGRVPAA